MTPELEALARRAVACKAFRWMPGMLADGAGFRVEEEMSPNDWDAVQCGAWGLPAIDDPATLGCLLYLVRDAWKIPGFCAIHRIDLTNGDELGWETGIRTNGQEHEYYETEVEALVVALECAR